MTNSDYFIRLPLNDERDTRCVVAGSRQVGCVFLSLGRLSSCGVSAHILQCPLAKTLSFLKISVLCLGEGREGTGVPRKPYVLKAPSHDNLTKHPPLSWALHWYTSSSRMGLSAQVCCDLMLLAMKAPQGGPLRPRS